MERMGHVYQKNKMRLTGLKSRKLIFALNFVKFKFQINEISLKYRNKNILFRSNLVYVDHIFVEVQDCVAREYSTEEKASCWCFVISEPCEMEKKLKSSLMQWKKKRKLR